MRSLGYVLWSFVLAVASLCAVASNASTTVPAGTISSSTTWALAGSPYIVNGIVNVNGAGNPVLTIEPGVTVQFVSSGELVVNHYDKGSVHAVGTSSSPITFTSNSGTAAGSWVAIYLNAAGTTASQFQHVIVENGGHTNLARGGIHVANGAHTFDNVTFRNNLVAGLSIGNGTPSVTNCTFDSNSGYGINVTGGAPTITNATITSNTDWAIGTPAEVQLNQLTGLTATGNGGGSKNAVYVRGGTIGASRRWFASGLPYIIGGSVNVNGGGDPKLTIDPGVTVKFAASGELVVNHYDKGSVSAVGSVSAPITFTSNVSTLPSAWIAIYLNSVGPTASQFQHVVIEYGGYAPWSRGGVHVANGAHTFDNVTFRNNAMAGLTIGNGTPTITNCTFENNTGFGINVTGGGPAINSSTFTGNSDYAIAAEASLQLTGMASLTAANNGSGAKNSTLLRGGTISQNRRWYVSALPYVLSGTLNIHGGSDPVLTIDPGTTVKFKSGADVTVNYYDRGSIQAVGTQASPILFTAETGTARGTWICILLGTAGTTNSRFEWTTVEYSGSTAHGRGAITVLGRAPVFDHVTFRENLVAGLRVHAGSPVISDATFTASSGFGLDVLDATPTITSSTFTDNGNYPIAVNANGELFGMTGLSGSNNGPSKDAVYLRAGTISSNRTWRRNAFPYVMEGTMNVHGGANPLLTIEAGVTVKFGSRADMTVNYYDKGAIQVLGTASEPVLLTSNGTATAGYWLAILLGGANTATESRFEHVTVEYAGSSSPLRGGIHVDGRAPVFDHVTFRNNLSAGLLAGNGSPTVTNCTFEANTGAGVELTNGTLAVDSSSFTNNTAYAIKLAPMVTLSSASSLTATGQPAGRNSIWWNGGTISQSRTWPATALPYVIGGVVNVHGSSTPVLTIAAGSTVKFEQNGELVVNYYDRGVVRAIGTAPAPILFTSNVATPAAGSWIALYIGNADQTTQQEFAFVTFEYGGYVPWGRGPVHVGGGLSKFDHVTFRNNAYAGLSISGGTSTISDCTFGGNPVGIAASGNFNADARRSYWGTADGPAGSGFGTGQAVAANVKFEPWLTAAPSAPQSFTSASAVNRTFNPNISTTSSLTFSMASAANWTLTVKDAASNVLRTLTGSGSPDTGTWDGKDGGGTIQPNGNYMYYLDTANATSLSGRMVVDTNKNLTGTASVVPLFSPNADGVLDVATITGTANYEDAAWTVTIRNGGGTMVRQMTTTGTPLNIAWDGKDGSGVLQPDATYTVDVDRAAGTANLTNVLSTVLDITAPASLITSPTAGQTLSNVYQNGSLDISIEGSAADANFDRWTLDYGAGASPGTWTTLRSNVVTPVASGQLHLWPTLNVNNNTYTFRLQAWDKAGMRTESRVTAALGNFKMSKNVDQFKPSASQTATYTSIVPFTLDETLVLKDAAGNVVRTLFNGSRTAATYNDVWNGLNDSNAIVPDGPYFYVATVTDGTHTVSWDQTSEMRTDGWLHHYPTLSTDFDPFNNKPLAITYTFNRPGRLYVILSPHDHPVPCVAPAYCWKNQMWQESGTHTLHWAGVDDSGQLRSDLVRTSVTSWMTSWPMNAVLVYGAKPTLSPVTVTPAFYGPAGGSQTVAFSLTTHQNQPATIQVTFRNQISGSVLRTVTQTAQPPGLVSVAWDGRADNGMWVAPGVYIVTASATDALGNTVTQQILTNIAY